MRGDRPGADPNGSRIRVLLADDHDGFRQGVREMLSLDEDIEVIGEAQNGREAVDLARWERPDVVLLDVEMPVMGAVEAMEGMHEISPPPSILIVTMYDNSRLIGGLMDRGTSGYLAKSASLAELLAAVREAASEPPAP